MLVNAGSLLWMCKSYRIIYIRGRFGGGKTSIAVRLYAELAKSDNYRLISNTNCIWRDRTEDVTLGDDNMLHSVVILDEGGLYFEDEALLKKFMAYCAKMDIIVLIPSFWPPANKAQVVTVQPLFSVGTLPIKVYQWTVRIGSWKESGKFLWVNPEEIYGVYSRQDPGDTATDIVKHLVNQSNEFRRRFGKKDAFTTISELLSEDQVSSMGEARRAAQRISDTLDEATQELEDRLGEATKAAAISARKAIRRG